MLKFLARYISGDRRAGSGVSRKFTFDFETSSVEKMRPLTTVVLWLGVLEFVFFLLARASLVEPISSLGMHLVVVTALVLLSIGLGRTRTVSLYGCIGILYVAIISIGFTFVSEGLQHMVSWLLPALMLVPITASPLWLNRQQFIVGTTTCLLVNLPAFYSVEMSAQEKVMMQLYFVMTMTLSTTLHIIFFNLRMQSFKLATSLTRQASIDGLTGLLNRRAFLEQTKMLLKQCDGDGQNVVALYLDVDNFKNINDSLGHAEGDRTLRGVASKLALHIREPDLIGRVGGEEFAVIATVDTDKAGLELAERLKDAMRGLELGVGEITISIGLAPRAANESSEVLLQRADTAMLQAKRNGRNRIEQFGL